MKATKPIAKRKEIMVDYGPTYWLPAPLKAVKQGPLVAPPFKAVKRTASIIIKHPYSWGVGRGYRFEEDVFLFFTFLLESQR